MDEGTAMDASGKAVEGLRILVIDDDPEFSEVLGLGLSGAGHEVVMVQSVVEGLGRLAEGGQDLLLLDLEVSGVDGMEVLRGLRGGVNPLPVIIMTGSRMTTENMVSGLDGGADDYVRKPFAVEEILARIGAVYRRHQGSREASCRVGDLTIDRLRRRVDCGGRPLELTLRELELLALLARHAGREVSRDEVRAAVWSDTTHSTTFDNTLDVHISRLRKKLGECGSCCTIKTVWGKGFTLHVEED